jgi:hypothetical protein
MLDMDSRLRVARGIAKNETLASIEVYGVVPGYCGQGRPPTRKRAGPGWLYLQMVKQRDERGRVKGIKLRVVFSKKSEGLALLGKSTAYIERSNLTSRLFNGRQVRKTLASSKGVAAYRVAAAWEDCYYNLVRPHKSLRLPVAHALPQKGYSELPPWLPN